MIDQVKIINYWLALILLSILWGGSFFLSKSFALIGLSQMQAASVKMLAAAILFLPFILRAYREIKHTRLVYVIVAAILVIGIPVYAMAFASQRVLPSLIQSVQAMTPLFIFFVSVGFFDTEFSLRAMLGSIIGLAGAIIISEATISGPSGSVLFAAIYAASCLMMAFGMLYVRKKLSNISTASISSYSFFILLVPTLVVLIGNNVPDQVLEFRTSQNGAIGSAFVGAITIGLAYYLFLRLSKKAGPMFAASSTFLVPIFFYVFALFEKPVPEKLNGTFFIGTACCIVGVLLINKLDFSVKRKKQARVTKYYHTR